MEHTPRYSNLLSLPRLFVISQFLLHYLLLRSVPETYVSATASDSLMCTQAVSELCTSDSKCPQLQYLFSV